MSHFLSSEHAKEDSRWSEDRIEKRNDLFQTLVKTYAAIDQIDDSVPEECSNSEIGQVGMFKFLIEIFICTFDKQPFKILI